MSSQEWNPRRLDIAAFARAGAEVGGSWPLAGFERLVDSTVHEALTLDAGVAWSARGESLAAAGRPPEIWLRLIASTTLPLQCQRCLGPVDTPLAFDRRILFVSDDETAEQLDADLDEDVMTLPRALDLHVLLEDELLLELPIVPRHEVCPEPLVSPALGSDTGQDAPHPFEVLAALRRDRSPG